ncbi:MAG: response regulator [Desulfobacterales bacterium]|nr:response regulator [Desulfobacterales bacterium]
MKARILVVDDDPQIRVLLTAFLERGGYETETADSAHSAITRMETGEYDIVLTDKNMPDGTRDVEAGMLVLKYIKEKAPSTEVIMITGFATIETAIEAMKMGAFDYIMKPVPMDELIRKIERILDYKKFINSENNLQIYRTLHNQILDQLKNNSNLPEDQVQHLLKIIGGRIDNVFGMQKEYETIIQLQAESLEKIHGYAEFLEGTIPEENPYSEIVDKIRDEAAKHVSE